MSGKQNRRQRREQALHANAQRLGLSEAKERDVAATVREPPYAMSKAAVRALVFGIAKEGGPFNVRCNEVVTGLVTGTRVTDTRPDRAAASVEEVPLGRLATV